MAANPAFARAFLVEILAAAADALALRTRVHERFAEQLRPSRAASPGAPPPPPHAFRACVGAINELATDHVIHRGTEALPELLEPIVAAEEALLLPPGPARRLTRPSGG